MTEPHPGVTVARMALWYALYGEIHSPEGVDIALCRERLEQFVERFGEGRTLQRLRTAPGLDTISLDAARGLLTRGV